jgi:TRAP-type C4-dicarboxylate transport system permease small subunit
MILALPMWWAYASLAPGLALTAAIALVQALRGRAADPAPS